MRLTSFHLKFDLIESFFLQRFDQILLQVLFVYLLFALFILTLSFNIQVTITNTNSLDKTGIFKTIANIKQQ